MTTYYTCLEHAPIPVLLTSNGAALTGLFLGRRAHDAIIKPDWVRDDDARPFVQAKQQLAAYFDGARTPFELPLAPTGTAFQKRVWDELTKIPYGTTVSYGELARRIGNPNAARAVGAANGHNPIAVVVPCHRVVGATGKLVGFNSGLERKEALLALEARVLLAATAPPVGPTPCLPGW